MKTRMTNRHYILTTSLVLVLLLVPMLACNFSLGSIGGKPALTEIVMAKQLDDKQKPVEPTTTFESTDTFFCSVGVSNLNVGSKITAKWYRDNESLDQFTITADKGGSGYVGFNLGSKGGGWPDGDYKVEVYLDNALVKAVNFSVKPLAGTTPVTGPTTTEEVAVAASDTPTVAEATSTPEEATIRPATPTVAQPTATRKIVQAASPTSVAAEATATEEVAPADTPTSVPPTATRKLALAASPTPEVVEPTATEEIIPSDTPISVPPTATRKIMTVPSPTPTELEPAAAEETIPADTPISVPPTATRKLALAASPTHEVVEPTATEETIPSDTPAPVPPTATRKIMLVPSPTTPIEGEPTATPGQAAEPIIGPLQFSTEVTADHQPVNPTTTFPSGTKTVYGTFEYQGFAAKVAFEQIWYLDGQETARGSFDWAEAESGQYEASLNNDQGLLSGNYVLEIHLNGKLLGSGKFVVQKDGAGVTPPPPPQPTEGVPEVTKQATGSQPAFSAITFATGVDSQGQPVKPGKTFETSTRVIYAIFDYSGMMDDTELSANLYLNGKKVLVQASLWDKGESGLRASVSLAQDRGFKAGQYKLELSVDGKVIQQGEFEVVEGTGPAAETPPAVLTSEPTTELTPPSEPTFMPTMDLTPPAVPTAAATKPKPPVSAGKIVYTRTDKDVHSLWTMNLDGSGQKKVADYASDPSWSPDGTAIVFFGWDGNPRGGSGIYTIQANGTGPKLIWNQGSASYLDWALSGRWVAMNTIVPDSANRRLVVYDGREGKWQDIGPGEQPSFSPNASQLVARTCIGGGCGLFVMNRDGSGMARITTSADDAMPAWSPLGNRIAFASQRDGNWDVWVMNTDGSGKTQLTTDPGVDAMPAWLPDGRGLVFRSSRGGAWGIWVMNADGSNPRKIINAPAANDWGRDRLDVR